MGHIKKTLSDYSKAEVLRLHMPGHKGNINPLDNTEIPQTDDINNPIGDYKKAQGFISDTYMSSQSFILTNGATLGIQATILYAKKSGYKIVAMRNSHMSVINACCAFEAECVFLDPKYDEKTNTYKSASDEVISYLNSTNEKCALLLTSPDYYGRCIDMIPIREAANKKKALVFCDQAHGSHFIYSELLPKNSSEYFDVWVNGAHKTLGALTQGAFVHCSANIDINIFSSILKALNTSSPSHLIAASLEEAVIESKGHVWGIRAKECTELTKKINSLTHIKCAEHSWAQSVGYQDKDVTRMIIDAKDAGGGYYLYEKLFKNHNIQLEMADFRYIVAIMTIYDNEDCDEIFFKALNELDIPKKMHSYPTIPDIKKAEIPIEKAWLSAAKYVSLDDAVGKISAATLGAYPPGTSMCLPGEVILKEHVEYLNATIALGGHMFGDNNGFIAIVDI